ncbi:MAG: FAD-dependent oxidoreductase [Anaerolineae bacterium]
MSAASKARRLDKDLEIVVYEQSGYVSYGSCGFPYYLKGEIPRIEDVIVRTPQDFAKQGIQAQVQHRVVKIDPMEQIVRVRDLKTQTEFTTSWDRLILTTGGVAVKPPIPGLDLPGIFTLRTVEDAVAIQAWLAEKQPKRAVIVGGGYIGLEMAEALAARGLHLTLVEALPQVMPNMDLDMANYVQQELERQQVELQLEHAVTAFTGQGRVQAVVAGGQEFPADLVIFSVGLKPGVVLAQQAGLVLGPTGAVAVDDHQQTSQPNVYAAGDALRPAI